MELSWALVAVVAVVAMLVGFFLGRKGGGNVVQVPSGPAPQLAAPQPAAPQPARPLSPRPQPVRQQPMQVEGDPAGWEADARAVMAAGNKIQAIKAVRDATGLGLKEAKDLVESWEWRR